MTMRVASALACVLVLAGCSQAGELVDQARGLQEQVDSIRWCSDVVRLSAAVETTNAEAVRNLVDALNRSGPSEIAGDVKVVEDAVVEIEDGSAAPARLGDDDVTAAMEGLVAAVDERCADQIGTEFGTG